MPPVIAAGAAVFSAIGAVGSAVAGGLAAAVGASATVSGVIGALGAAALQGAVLGGLTAAVTGNDIGKGALMGAATGGILKGVGLATGMSAAPAPIGSTKEAVAQAGNAISEAGSKVKNIFNPDAWSQQTGILNQGMTPAMDPDGMSMADGSTMEYGTIKPPTAGGVAAGEAAKNVGGDLTRAEMAAQLAKQNNMQLAGQMISGGAQGYMAQEAAKKQAELEERLQNQSYNSRPTQYQPIFGNQVGGRR